MSRVLDCAGRDLDLSRTAIMGILNVTPDSFSDGGLFMARDGALRHAEELARDGADIIDVGGESTRPGAAPVSESEELDRVVPIVEALAARIEAVISVDTSKPAVMRAAVGAGAALINDVRALRLPAAVEAAADLAVPVCLMHMRGEPQTMQDDPSYDDVVEEVARFLGERIAACRAAGIPDSRLLVDPGFGFGKTADHNLELLRRLDALTGLGAGILVGLSRKSLIGRKLGIPLAERMPASVALALIAVKNGARIVRVHDVRPTRDALRMWETVHAVGF